MGRVGSRKGTAMSRTWQENAGLLALRVGVGGVLAAHGVQKLFGWLGGHGLEGTGTAFEQMGFQPGRQSALAAGLGEAGGGLLGKRGHSDGRRRHRDDHEDCQEDPHAMGGTAPASATVRRCRRGTNMAAGGHAISWLQDVLEESARRLRAPWRRLISARSRSAGVSRPGPCCELGAYPTPRRNSR